MLTERRRSSRLVLSFVSASSQLANKENTLLAVRTPASPLRSRRRTRTLVTNWSAIAARRRRSCARASRPQPLENVQMAPPNPEPPSPSPSPPRRLMLPRHLVRPQYRAIDPRAIAAIDPVLEDIPLSYLHHTLAEIGPQMLRATCETTTTPLTGHLPRELQIVCNDVSIEPPSHVFATYTSADTPLRGITLFPAHALIVATHCAHLPALPPSKPEPGRILTLPVVPLRIPSPADFPVLLSYLYTKRADHLLAELLPLPLGDEATSTEQLTRKLATAYTLQALIGHAHRVHGLWSNAAALGVFDDKLFRSLETAWEVLLGALGATRDEGIEVDAE